MELREFHRAREKRGNPYVVNEGDIVTIYDEGHPSGLCWLGKVESLVHGADGVVRGVHVRVMSRKGHPKTAQTTATHLPT